MAGQAAKPSTTDDMKPLFIDVELEGSPLFPGHSVREAIHRRIRRIFEYLGLVNGPPYGYRSVMTQLQDRHVFPHEQWAVLSLPPESVREVLYLIQLYGCWPNHHILPSDQLWLLTSCSAFSLASASILFDVSRRFHIDCGESRFRDLLADKGTTVGQFVHAVLTAQISSGGQGGSGK